MKNILFAIMAILGGTLAVVAPVEARPIQEVKITIHKYGKSWKVTQSTAIARCNASNTDPQRKNWNIYCEYVPQVAEKKQCQFLFWKSDCETPVAKKEDSTLPGVGAKRSGILESNNVGLLAKAESMIGLDARRDRATLKQQLSQANRTSVDPAHIPWCAAWANLVLSESGMETTGSLLARSFLNWGKPVHGVPSIGDVVVMRRGRNKSQGHVGFFYAFVDLNGTKMVAVLGGNQGKEVRISYYPITKVIAYRTANV